MQDHPYAKFEEKQFRDLEMTENQTHYIYPNEQDSTPRFKTEANLKCLTIWRIIALLICIVVWVFYVLGYYDTFGSFWGFLESILKFLTNWGMVFTTLFFLIALITQPESKLEHQVSSILFTLSFCLEIVITAIFWFALYTGKYNNDMRHLADITMHTIPIFLLVIDLIFNRLRFYAKQSIIVMMLIMISYTVVNVLYCFFDKPIYPILDWVSLTSYIYYIAALVLYIVGFLIVWGVTKCKMKSN